MRFALALLTVALLGGSAMAQKGARPGGLAPQQGGASISVGVSAGGRRGPQVGAYYNSGGYYGPGAYYGPAVPYYPGSGYYGYGGYAPYYPIYNPANTTVSAAFDLPYATFLARAAQDYPNTVLPQIDPYQTIYPSGVYDQRAYAPLPPPPPQPQYRPAYTPPPPVYAAPTTLRETVVDGVPTLVSTP